MGKLARFIYYYTGNIENDAPDTEHTASGAVVHFTTKESAPVTSLTAAINPVQDLHGQESPYPAGGGKNLFDEDNTNYINKSVSVYGTNDEKAVSLLNSLPAGTYTLSLKVKVTPLNDAPAIKTNVGLYFRGVNNGTQFNVIGMVNGIPTVGAEVTKSVTFTLTDDYVGKFQYCYVYTGKNTSVSPGVIYTGIIYDVQIEPGFTATSYVPYSNVCPITGWTGANVHVSSAQGREGTVYSVEWQTEAGTVYGGTVDVTTGVLTVTHANIASYDGETLSGVWISSMDVYAEGSTPTTGAQVVYELAEPQTYELTPSEVQTLVGENFIWADTGDVTVTYKGTPST